MNKVTDVQTFGDVRRLIVQTIMQIRDGELGTTQGMAIAANMRELNSNIQSEINAAKLFLRAEELGHDFGKLARMGQQTINGEEPQVVLRPPVGGSARVENLSEV